MEKKKENKAFQKFLEHCARQKHIKKTFDFNKKQLYIKTIKKHDKQTIVIEKHICKKGLTESKKMNEEIIHQKDTEMEILLNIKFLNLIIAEAFSN